MDEKRLFVDFWIAESKTTRNVLARIPEGSDYKPDARSRTAQEIAWQIVCEEQMLIDSLETGTMKWEPAAAPSSMEEVLRIYEKHAGSMPGRFAAVHPDRWSGKLDFFGTARLTMPLAWSFLFDIVHHRGQITTYLRPMGSTVPRIYGPSADEP